VSRLYCRNDVFILSMFFWWPNLECYSDLAAVFGAGMLCNCISLDFVAQMGYNRITSLI